MSSPPLNNSRETAACLLHQWLSEREMPARLMESVQQDRGFVNEVVLGVVRHERGLEWMIAQLADHQPKPKILACLMVGLYQLFLLDHVEAFAAVHETVEAAKTLCGQRQASFINAILRRSLREREKLWNGLRTCPLPIRSSHPDNLIARWVRQFGTTDTEKLCDWNNLRPELLIRTRPPITRKQLHLSLSAARPHPADDFLILPAGTRPQDCPGYWKGWFMVQDPATQLSVDLLGPQAGEHILDSCAAPGGKTIAIADRVGTGTVVARDINATRLRRIEENIERCGLKNVKVGVGDGTLAVAGDLFDGILLDVPCTNTGVIRRRPDVRYRISDGHLQDLLVLQARLLDQAARQVKVGGRIVYSTCSLETEENEQQIAQWLAGNPSFELQGQVRSFPPRDKMDGAYAAKLVRRA